MHEEHDVYPVPRPIMLLVLTFCVGTGGGAVLLLWGALAPGCFYSWEEIPLWNAWVSGGVQALAGLAGMVWSRRVPLSEAPTRLSACAVVTFVLMLVLCVMGLGVIGMAQYRVCYVDLFGGQLIVALIYSFAMFFLLWEPLLRWWLREVESSRELVACSLIVPVVVGLTATVQAVLMLIAGGLSG